jgi:hypothetical protein
MLGCGNVFDWGCFMKKSMYLGMGCILFGVTMLIFGTFGERRSSQSIKAVQSNGTVANDRFYFFTKDAFENASFTQKKESDDNYNVDDIILFIP